MAAPDAIVIGAGPNGLVAANKLADAGWEVLVLEAQETVGGAVRSDRELHEDYVQDTFSAFYPLGAASPAITSLDLESHGLRWSHAPAPLGNPQQDRPWALLHRDVDVTATLMDQQHPGDGDAWRAMHDDWLKIGDQLVEALMTPFPPVRGGLRTLLALRKVGGLDYVKMLLEPAQHLGRSRFGGSAPQLLLTGNAGHADIPMDATGSGLMALLLTMLAQTVGYPVPVGGAGRLTEALADRLVSLGGTISCSTHVEHIETRDGRVTGVRTSEGETIVAGRAVIADVSAVRLYGDLVDHDALPDHVHRAMRGFQLDPGTVKVDWALDGPVPWAVTPDHAPGTVHIGDSVDQIVDALNQVSANAVPADPFLLTGQMTTSDPTRSPPGTESFWAYTHVPQHPRHDAGDGTVKGTWDRDDSERFADRIQARVEKYAPGFASRIVARRVLAPPDLETRDANLVGGAINGGTSGLHQQLVFRPIPGLGRASTPIKGLFLGSASAHPGGGVHGAPGANAARAALAAARFRRVLR